MTVVSSNIVRATVNMLMPDSSTHQNVFFYRAGSGVNDTDSNVIAAIETSLGTAYADIDAMLNTNNLFGDVEVALSTNGGATFFDIGSQPMSIPNPVDTTDMSPHGVAAVIRFGGEGTGRQGRKFIGGISEDWFTRSTIITLGVSNLALFATLLNNDIAVAGGDLEFGWLRRTPLSFIKHSGVVTVNTTVGYQRRRKPGVGV